MTLSVSIAERADLGHWEEFVNRHPDACVFHTWAWREVVEAAYGHQACYLMVRRNGQVCGVLPLFLIASRVFHRVLASSPYASYGAICADDPEAARGLVDSAIELARQHRVAYLELKSTRPSPSDNLERHCDYDNFGLSLDSIDQVWRVRFDHDSRKAVRKAVRLGLALRLGTQWLDQFYDVMTVNMRKLGTPVHSLTFYRAIVRCFGPQARVAIVTHEERPIAGILGLSYRNQFCALYAASLPEALPLRPNNFMYWEMFKAARASGADWFDFGRSLAGSGHAEFKKSMGAEATPLCYEYFLNTVKDIPHIHANNPRFALPRRVWSRLPLAVTRWLGPHLIKDIP